MDEGAHEDVIILPKGMTSAFVYVPKYGGVGAFGKGRKVLKEQELGDISGIILRLFIRFCPCFDLI